MSNPSDSSKDNVLEMFVMAANKHNFKLDVTLNLKGSVVTGTMVSAGEYFESLSEAVGGGTDIAQKLSGMLEKAVDSTGDGNTSGANFIHLVNTKVFCGDSKPTPAKGDFFWRGKLSEIDGFFLGRIAEGNPKGA